MTDWREQAECRHYDHNLWFPEQGESNAHAKSVCRVCPVRDACLQDALLTGERHGVRGGYTATEREGMRPRREMVA